MHHTHTYTHTHTHTQDVYTHFDSHNTNQTFNYRPAQHGHVNEGREEHRGSGEAEVRVQQKEERRGKEAIWWDLLNGVTDPLMLSCWFWFWPHHNQLWSMQSNLCIVPLSSSSKWQSSTHYTIWQLFKVATSLLQPLVFGPWVTVLA